MSHRQSGSAVESDCQILPQSDSEFLGDFDDGVRVAVFPAGDAVQAMRVSGEAAGAAGGPEALLAGLQQTALEFNLDGPNGRPSVPLERCSSLVLFGGGIGVTPLLPILSMVACSGSATGSVTQTTLPKLRHLVFVWSVRSPEAFSYAAEELRSAAASIATGPAADRPTIEVCLHLTSGATMPAGAAVEHAVECSRPDVSAILTRVKAADAAEGVFRPGARAATGGAVSSAKDGSDGAFLCSFALFCPLVFSPSFCGSITLGLALHTQSDVNKTLRRLIGLF